MSSWWWTHRNKESKETQIKRLF